MKVLIMEDDPKLSSFVKLGLEKNDCLVDIAYDSDMAEKLAMRKKYDVIILDVIVPGMNGFELCRKLRNNRIVTPVIMLTSLDSTEDKVTGFDCGADDYLLKPFQFLELLARIRALHRRNKGIPVVPSILISDLEINTVTKKVKRNKQEIKLTALEYKILELLASQKGKVFERLEITEKVWGNSFNTGTNFVDVHINSLRNKIDRDYSQKLIHTVIGLGYKVDEEE
jgi:two-component system, OmpR family, copper resistance phosphate regulon response regulator CusR